MPKTFSTTSKPTTNANLTGVITSVGNATSIASQTGTGTKFVVDTTPTLVTPVIGVATGTSLDLGATTLYASRAITVDTGGVLNIDIGSAAGDDFTVDTNKLVVEGDTGNVGIGTTNPGAKLEVNEGNIKITKTVGAILDLYSISNGNFVRGFRPAGTIASPTTTGASANLLIFDGNGYGTTGYSLNAGRIGIRSAGVFSDTSYPTEIYFSTTPASSTTLTQRMVIDNAGNVGIGTTGPNYKLEVSTDSAGKPGIGGLWTVVSDERIKTDIQLADLDRCYEIIKTIPLKRFGWAEGVYTDEQVKDRHGLGWIAQDVQKVFPKAVNVVPFTKKIDTGKTEDVVDKTTGEVTTKPIIEEEVIEDCLDLNSGQIIAALFGAVQKLQQKIEALEMKVTSTIVDQKIV